VVRHTLAVAPGLRLAATGICNPLSRSFSMNQRLIVSSALASVLAMGLLSAAQAADDGKEKCFGVAKAGKNDCSNLSGSHSCAGQAKADNMPDDWKAVAKGTCKQMGGKTEAEAKAAPKS
jgi:uncharacterized membrane protein